jgi:hypothetical protein
MAASGYAASLAVVIALYLWGTWVARRQATPLFRLAARGVLAGGVLALVGAGWAMRQVAIANGAVPSDSSSDATRYAQGISDAFARAALPIGLGNLILLACIVVLAVGTLRLPASGPPTGNS